MRNARRLRPLSTLAWLPLAGLAPGAGATPIHVGPAAEPLADAREGERTLFLAAAAPGAPVDPVLYGSAAGELEVQAMTGLPAFEAQPDPSAEARATPADAAADREPAVAAAPRAESAQAAARLVAEGDRRMQSGDLDGALERFGRALALDPDLGDVHARVGLALLQLGRFGEAEPHLQRAVELGSGSALIHAGLAETAKRDRRYAEAVAQGREALKLDPGLLPAANNLAWVLATSPDANVRDPLESIRISRAALRSAGGAHPGILDTLAAGYAAAGRYDEAVATASRAEALARKRGRAELARRIRSHRERYAAGQPIRDS